MSEESLVLWHCDAMRSELRTDDLSKANQGEVKLRAIVSMVSTGTEKLVATGNVPISLQPSMRVPLMQGTLSLPCSYGYSMVAEVIEAKPELLGKRVHLMAPHQSHMIAPERDVMIIDSCVTSERVALISNVETTINAIWDSKVTLGSNVLVVGFGSIGALLALTLRQTHFGKITVLEKSEERATAAQKMGFVSHVFEQSKELNQSFDVAFNTSCSSEGLQSCINLTGQESRIVELSWYGNRSTELTLGESFHLQRKQIISSQVSQIPAGFGALWDYRRRKRLALKLIESGAYDDLMIDCIPFTKSPDFFNALRNNTNSNLTLFTY